MIAFSSRRGGARDIYLKPASGVQSERLLVKSASNKAVETWSGDGQRIIFASDTDLWSVSIKGGTPELVIGGLSSQHQAQISPDGKWIAYTSAETGRGEVYVQPVPPSGAKWQVSLSGGGEPAWRKDGSELYYVNGKTFMAVAVQSTTTFRVENTWRLFEARLPDVVGRNRYVVHPDGQRFFAITLAEPETAAPIRVMTDWLPR
jgi:hypothetical protein